MRRGIRSIAWISPFTANCALDAMSRATLRPRSGYGLINPLHETSVTSPTHHDDTNFDAASSQLNDGLRSCRSVVSNYRALLAGDADDGLGNAGYADNDARDEEAAD